MPRMFCQKEKKGEWIMVFSKIGLSLLVSVGFSMSSYALIGEMVEGAAGAVKETVKAVAEVPAAVVEGPHDVVEATGNVVKETVKIPAKIVVAPIEEKKEVQGAAIPEESKAEHEKSVEEKIEEMPVMPTPPTPEKMPDMPEVTAMPEAPRM